MSCHSRRILPAGASRKRKEREAFYSSDAAQNQLPPKPAAKAETETSLSSNHLLAGYMAYEFLTRGTLFGQKVDPASSGAVPVAGGSSEPKRGKPLMEVGGPTITEEKKYAEVAGILKSEGAHIPGVINPTQLARWIQM